MRRFTDIYCQREHLATERFAGHLLQRTLYPHARVLAPLLRTLDRQHFLADNEFVQDVGNLTRTAHFAAVMQDYSKHYANHGILRRTLRLRISVRRMQRLVFETFAEEMAAERALKASLDPFPRAPSPQEGERTAPGH